MREKIGRLVVFLSQILHSGSCSCYFSTEYQGTYLTQSHIAHGGSVEYSRVDILPTSIPVWGECYRKLGSNVVLKQPVLNCFRCVRLSLRSPNVLQVYARAVDKCFTRESTAIQSCPTEREVFYQEIENFLLFKIVNNEGKPGLTEVYCPINGQYTFTYSENPSDYSPSSSFLSTSSSSSSSPSSVCSSPYSTISNCPFGYSLTVEYKNCNFPSYSSSWQCLAFWPGPREEMFLVVQDTSPGAKAKYRCGLYHESPGTGRVDLALSRDSTCTGHLISAKQGYEEFSLVIKPTLPWPAIVTKTGCRFPSWTEGHWEDLFIEGSTLVFQDRRNFKTFSSQCVQQSPKNRDRYLIYARTQCGEELYNCVWMVPRGPNIMEFQMGLKPSRTPTFQHCDNDHFLQRTWHTQAKKNPGSKLACPISGDYTGILPDAPELCAKMSSDCNNPDVMFYSVAECSNQSNVLQDREYRCLGQWEEDGVLYTYTQRKDIPGYECFVGIEDSQGRVVLAEAGSDCKRGLRIESLGMILNKKNNCYGLPTRNDNTMTDKEERTPGNNQGLSTRPWLPIIGESEMDSSYMKMANPLLLLFLLILLLN